MSNEEILKKAIEKAVENGYRGFDLQGKRKIDEVIIDEINTKHEYHPLSIKLRLRVKGTTISYYLGLYEIIFSHDFAKAFWGEQKQKLWKCPKCGFYIQYYKHNETQTHCPADGRKLKDVEELLSKYEQKWATHLQQMVLEEDPIKYLEKFI